jgi:carboxypeptidase Taq
MTAYDRLATRFARIATIGEASSILGWDAATIMPPGGGAARGDQLAVLAGMAHSPLTAPVVGEDLAAADEESDAWRAANLRLMRHAFTRATASHPDLVEAQARANSACEKVWREARRTSDFAMVRPHLEEVVRLTREAAAALAPALGLSPYDALMDGHQRGARAADIVPVFANYEGFLRAALPRAEELQARLPAPQRPSGPFPIGTQEALCRRLSERLGLDFAHARLDRSAHPFSGGTPNDVRITSRYVEADFTQAVLAVVH